MSFNFMDDSNEDIVDTNAAVEMEGWNEAGTRCIGKFIVKYVHPTDDVTLVKLNRIDRKFNITDQDAKNNPFKVLRVRFCEMHLTGWSGVLDDKGKEVTYSPEAAHAFFGLKRNRKALLELNREAQNIDNFLPVKGDDPEEIAGN